ncbi:chaperonin GroS protein [Cardiosporidium cionae]|uniref:Chaperonin GroS protein n=1 Tax=Cardiosporidium cionae TaxID=476202 RepID=A0ABQ7JF43_9APIC|nr:chaperonin GroS protein [Cardiosporidium cionae]|eukprot:KAF8822581.1 chaperonin GroS protein [Cardiosporidium cionae]
MEFCQLLRSLVVLPVLLVYLNVESVSFQLHPSSRSPISFSPNMRMREAFRGPNLARVSPMSSHYTDSLKYTEYTGIMQKINKSPRLSMTTLDDNIIRRPLKPVGRMLFVRPKDCPEKTPGGILLPMMNRVKESIGQVESVSDGAVNAITGIPIPMNIKVGDWIIFGRQEYQEVNYNNNEHGLIPIDSVYALLRDPMEGLNVQNVTPLRDIVYVKILKNEDKTASGLILSQNSDHAYRNAEVLSVGLGDRDANGKLLPMGVQAGDFVRFNAFAIDDRQLTDGKTDFAFVRMADILAKW